MSGIVYTTSKQQSITSGPLPGYTGNVTWDDLNDLLKAAKELIKNQYIIYLNADLAGNTTAKQNAVTAMNTILQSVSQDASALGDVRIYLLNNASVIRAASRPADVGVVETGRTEIIVSQTERYVIANNIRTSSTVKAFTWYGGLAMGAFAKDCEYPAHVLKIAISR